MRLPFHVRSWIFAASLAAGPALPAQWLNYPTAGVPRKPDGSPNLSAPAPRARDGKPDLSGIWAPVRRRALDESLDGQVNATGPFWDFGSVVPGGLPYQAWAAEVRNKRLGPQQGQSGRAVACRSASSR
jgi:hypothetical protein